MEDLSCFFPFWVAVLVKWEIENPYPQPGREISRRMKDTEGKSGRALLGHVQETSVHILIKEY